MNLKILILFCCILTAGCSIYQVDTHETSLEYFPPKASSQAITYMDEVNQAYEEIGTVTVTAERRQPMEEILDKMKQEAALLGGDALTGLETDAGGMWKKIKPQKLLGNAYIRANYTAKVIALKNKNSITSQ